MLEPPSVQSVEHLFRQITIAIWKASMHLRLVGAHLVIYIVLMMSSPKLPNLPE